MVQIKKSQNFHSLAICNIAIVRESYILSMQRLTELLNPRIPVGIYLESWKEHSSSYMVPRNRRRLTNCIELKPKKI